MGKNKPRRQRSAQQRAHALEMLGTAAATASWQRSDNPIKRRIATLEVGWREAMQWLLEDIQAMFQNFGIVADAYDQLDINIAALKAVLIEKGVITEEEFAAKQQHFIGIINAERERRQQELEKMQQEQELEDEAEAARVAEAEAGATDGSHVDPQLQEMRRRAVEAGESSDLPDGAFIFGD
jgi:hypothetical protein